MLILLLLYFASHSWAKEVPRDSNYTLKYVSSCPEAGYFFHREPTLNSLVAPCFLCFCQGRNTAICWPRENRKCDLQHYKHNSTVAKKESRSKRSPLGFGDVFFKDAARGVFNKAQPEDCKPYESSFSEGCPPVDWCTGCTVCDCDADGHWDCHILSFCDDEKDKGKKVGKKGNTIPLKYPKSRRSSKSSKHKISNTAMTTRKPPLRTWSTTKKTSIKKFKKGPSKAIKSNSVVQKGKPPKPLIIKKNDKNPKVVKTSHSKRVLNGSETELNDQIMKGMIAAMQKMWTKQVTSALPDIVNMVEKKAFASHNQNKKGGTPVKYKKLTPAKKSSNGHTYNKSLFVRKQKREEQKKEIQRKRERQKKEALAAKINAAKKQVPKAVNRNNKPINRSNNKSTKKPTKSTNRPTTKKPNSKPINKNNKPKNNSNNKRKKREADFNNRTSSFNSNNISGMTLTPVAYVQPATEQEIIVESPTTTSLIDDIVTKNTMNTNTHYYEYSVHDVTTKDPRVSNAANYIDPKIEGVEKKVVNVTNSSLRLEKEKLNLANEIPHEVANDIKLTKWSEIKMFQVKQNVSVQNLNKTHKFEKEQINKINETRSSALEDRRKQIIWRDIEKKNDRTTKKYSLLRMVNTQSCKNKRGSEINFENLSETSLSSKIENLRSVLKRLLGEFRGNESSSIVNKRKKTNAIKYLKKFFNKIFFMDANNTSINQRMRTNNHTIQMLCESFGPCIVNKRNKVILMKKINELNNETVLILKSLRIIKGLLRLIDIPYNTTTLPLNKTSNFKKDIHKLNIILKKSFDNDKDNKELTETQRVQINYIRTNTKVFTESVAKFTKILNEIINLVSIKSNNQRRWNFETRSKLSKYNATIVEPIKKLKQLLHNYNIVHNAFIAKIIDMFTNLQTNNKTVDVTETEYYSKKEMKNLNKLKNLASALNPLKRQKRHAVRQDNTVEYLLMLMEYMFQQNKLDNSPVNDGIDLLIDAIKNAPDIRSVKKKVLKNNPFRTNGLQTAEPILNKNVSYEDSISDNNISVDDSVNKISNEDSKSILTTVDNSSSTDQGEAFDDENESDLTKMLRLKDANEQTETNTTTANKDDINFTSVNTQKYKNPNDLETTTDMPNKVYIAEDDALTEFNSRLEKASGELSKQTDAFFSDLDEETNTEESSGALEVVAVKEEVTEIPIVPNSNKAVSKSYLSTTKTANFHPITERVAPKLNAKKAKMNVRRLGDNSESAQVINNTLDQRPRKTSKVENKSVAKVTSQVSNQVIKPVQIFEIDLSEASKEESEEKSKVKIRKGEDVMIKKDQQLLNSLDYGTEASVVEYSEAKDGGEEKFLNDYFPE